MTKDEALKMALDWFESGTFVYPTTFIIAIKEALAQPEQKPVAFYVYKPTLPRGHLGNVSDGDLPWVYDQDPSSGYSARMLVYTTPPKREWVGLTSEELMRCLDQGYGINMRFDGFAKIIEAKLKELNT